MRHVGECALERNVGPGADAGPPRPRLAAPRVPERRARQREVQPAATRWSCSSCARTTRGSASSTSSGSISNRWTASTTTACSPACRVCLGFRPHASTIPSAWATARRHCVYEVSWSPEGDWVRAAVGAGAGSAAALGATALLAPMALPAAAGRSLVAAALTARRVLRTRRARWRSLERDLRSQAQVTDRLFTSMQDLVSELRIDEVLAKITENAAAAVDGKEFALLLEEDGRLLSASDTALPDAATAAIETWASATARLDETALLARRLHRRSRAGCPGRARGSPALAMRRAVAVPRPAPRRARRAGRTRPHFPAPRRRPCAVVRLAGGDRVRQCALLRHAAGLASRDPLTGLLNHREFHETLERELERARRSDRPVSVATARPRRFKRVNDQQGHARGDVVLAAVGEAITARRGPAISRSASAATSSRCSSPTPRAITQRAWPSARARPSRGSAWASPPPPASRRGPRRRE